MHELHILVEKPAGQNRRALIVREEASAGRDLRRTGPLGSTSERTLASKSSDGFASSAFVAPGQAVLQLANPPQNVEDAERQQIRIPLRQVEEKPGLVRTRIAVV
jgi:hypothetical protein